MLGEREVGRVSLRRSEPSEGRNVNEVSRSNKEKECRSDLESKSNPLLKGRLEEVGLEPLR